MKPLDDLDLNTQNTPITTDSCATSSTMGQFPNSAADQSVKTGRPDGTSDPALNGPISSNYRDPGLPQTQSPLRGPSGMGNSITDPTPGYRNDPSVGLNVPITDASAQRIIPIAGPTPLPDQGSAYNPTAAERGQSGDQS